MKDDSVPFSPSAFATWLRYYGGWFGLQETEVERLILAIGDEIERPSATPPVPSPFRRDS